MLMRIAIVISLLALLNLYAASRIMTRWAWAGEHLLFTYALFFGFFALQLLGPFGERLIFPKLKKAYNVETLVLVLNWASYLAFGILSFLVVFAFATDIISFIWKWVAAPTNLVDFDRRTLLALGIATIGTTIIGIRQAFVGPAVRTIEIPLENLPIGFDGFKIVQISDLHVGPTIGHSYTQNVVNIANQLNPDLIALTGDFVDGTVEDLMDDLAPILQLCAPHGTFFVTGNHEYYWDASAWMDAFRTLGADVLANEHRLIHRNGDRIVLAGVTDYSMRGRGVSIHTSDPVKALEGAPSDLVKILLAHQPASYLAAHDAGFDLQLSGHTHAGQYFPFNFFIRFFQRFYKGLNRYETLWIYVNSGTGYWGPPLRAGVPSEITLITLRTITK